MVEIESGNIEVAVEDEAAAVKLRAIALRIGIPDGRLRLTRPLFFLAPYAGNDPRNEQAREEHLATGVQWVTEDAGYQLTGLPPVVADGARVLVLGSMPGATSLRTSQYYAHPRNRFWGIMEVLHGISTQWPFAERASALTSAGLALWDVLKHCERIGSLDIKIVPATEVPNDLSAFLGWYRTIERIVFNGKKAAASFRRLVTPNLEPRSVNRLEMVTAPSTSPANTRLSDAQIVDAWREALG